MVAATSSPALSIIDAGSPGGTATPSSLPPAGPTGVRSPGVSSFSMQRSETAKSARGLNKPKCITCGNVARSRCPFQCCKSCCFKAQNPCLIHVLKPNATLADRGAPANSTVPEQQPSEVTPPVETRLPAKVNSIRQLSSAYAQFNNLHIPLRSRKPLSKKDALVINEWRFAKLKEYKDSNIKAENEAFDRYMENISLLEEVFDIMSESPEDDSSKLSNLPTTSSGKAELVSDIKAKLRSNPARIDSFRKRVRQTVDEGLRNFQMYESNDRSNSLDDEVDPAPTAKKNWWGGQTSALTELIDKLSRAGTEEDKIKGLTKSSSQKAGIAYTSNVHNVLTDLGATPGSDSYMLKFVRASEIEQDMVNSMDAYFSSLEDIEDL